ncbi:zinc transporter ZIP13-like [Dreissena polymorpha]|nr:zinc transporter ZIP13-like [Dreissena polymorpha]
MIMAVLHTHLHLVCYLTCVTVVSAEIHRATTNPSKYAKQDEFFYVDDLPHHQAHLKLDNQNSAKHDWLELKMQTSYETWIYSIGGAILVGLSGIFPLLVIPIEAGPALRHGAAAARLKLLLSFAVGGLLGDVFLHLLPEAWQHLNNNGNDHEGHTRLGLWVIAGMLSFLIIEKMFAQEGEFDHLEDECSEAEEEEKAARIHDNSESTAGLVDTTDTDEGARQRTVHNYANHISNKQNGVHVTSDVKITAKKADKSKEKDNIKVSGYLNLAANVIDNFTHGLAVAGGFLVSSKVGFITLLAILLHEIPHEVGDFAILLRSGFDRWKAAKAQLLTATGGMLGALTALTADSARSAGESTAWILPFTSGGFVYIALVTIVPDLLEEKHLKESVKQVVCLISGVATMYLVSLVH